VCCIVRGGEVCVVCGDMTRWQVNKEKALTMRSIIIGCTDVSEPDITLDGWPPQFCGERPMRSANGEHDEFEPFVRINRDKEVAVVVEEKDVNFVNLIHGHNFQI
jgi:hypothetical protein